MENLDEAYACPDGPIVATAMGTSFVQPCPCHTRRLRRSLDPILNIRRLLVPRQDQVEKDSIRDAQMGRLLWLQRALRIFCLCYTPRTIGSTLVVDFVPRRTQVDKSR